MNPFSPDRPARKSSFVSRRRPLNLVMQALEKPAEPLLVVGLPRMGKTSLILEGAGRMGAEAPTLIHVDLTTASTLADVAGRLLRQATLSATSDAAASTAHGLASAVGFEASVRRDPTTGRSVAGLKRFTRALPEAAQREVLTTTLDALNAMAAEVGAHTAVVLEGIESLAHIGGGESLWHLREALGRQTKLRQVLTTDDPELARTGTEAGGPFAEWGRTAQLVPIRPKRMAKWIRAGMRSAEARISDGAVDEILSRGGTRTGDVVRLAAAAFDQAGGAKVGKKSVARAFDALANNMSGWFRSDWRALTSRQQNLLRALAAEESRPFAADVRKQYDLRSSAAVARSLELLIQKGLVSRSDQGYAVDNPFFRHWIARTALPDIGPRDS